MKKNSIGHSYILFWKNIINFNGRTRRSDYWNAFLINVILQLLLSLLVECFAVKSLVILYYIFSILYFCFSIVFLIPQISISVRRLHDIGKSGVYYFLTLIPIVGQVLLLIWFTQDSQPGANTWGNNPKNPNTEDYNEFNEKDNKKICIVCGTELNEDDIICPKCGCEISGADNYE